MAKNTLTPQQILANVKNGNIQPVYYLMGEESYFIDNMTDALLKTLINETEREFDLSVVYGKDTDMRQVISLCRQYPMMSRYKVVLVREAQDMKDMENLSLYLEKSMPTTVLIINHKNGTLDRRKKITQEIESKAVLFESKKLYENEVPSWIVNQAKSLGMSMDDRTAALLSEFLGNDLSRIVGELDKLSLCLPKGENRISLDLVEKNIGISKEYNDFELQTAIVSKNVLKANKISVFYSKNPRNFPIQKTIALLAGFFGNLMMYHYLVDKSSSSAAQELGVAPFRMKEVIEGAKNYNAAKTMNVIGLLRTFDAKSKGFESKSIPDAELLRELLYKIMH
jgi:DNA polymerase III subunit delta